MTRAMDVDVAVLGGGPAGLAAVLAAREAGADALLIEREDRLGGILKQCIHDGFGLVRYGRKLTGPEYALRDADRFGSLGIPALLESFVTRAERADGGFRLTCIDKGGAAIVSARALVLATGCRERTDRQVFIHGDRPAGIYTAGLAQYMMNVQGLLPGRRAVILGSGDIGLIMARRLSLEGVAVEGAYEIKCEPSGLSRNVRQCLDDFGIPLTLSTTVTRVLGRARVEGVEVAPVDASMRPIAGAGLVVPCDTLILSVGLIPENELAQSLGVPIDRSTKGPAVDQNMQTLVDGIFACGNAVHVNDLADYVSESGETAGRAAAAFAWAASAGRKPARALSPVAVSGGFLYAVPQFVDPGCAMGDAVFYFRSRSTMAAGASVVAAATGSESVLFSRKYPVLRPPEMERFTVGSDALREALEPGGGGAGLSIIMEDLEAERA